jgi:hypothetical protein
MMNIWMIGIAAVIGAVALGAGLVIGYLVASIGINQWCVEVTGINIPDLMKKWDEQNLDWVLGLDPPLQGAPTPADDPDGIAAIIERMEANNGEN